MGKRVMPKAGFYVIKPNGQYARLVLRGYKDAIYTTGVRGGGGHKYCRDFGNVVANNPNHPLEWGTLLWSCVPGIKELNSDYDYYPNWASIPKSWGFPKP